MRSFLLISCLLLLVGWPFQIVFVFGQNLIDVDVKNVKISNASEIKHSSDKDLTTMNNYNEDVVKNATSTYNIDSNGKRIERNIFYPPPIYVGYPVRRYRGFYGRRRFFRRRRYGFYG